MCCFKLLFLFFSLIVASKSEEENFKNIFTTFLEKSAQKSVKYMNKENKEIILNYSVS